MEPTTTTAREPLGLGAVAALGTVVGVWAHPDGPAASVRAFADILENQPAG